jgi:hypothetical protein
MIVVYVIAGASAAAVGYIIGLIYWDLLTYKKKEEGKDEH